MIAGSYRIDSNCQDLSSPVQSATSKLQDICTRLQNFKAQAVLSAIFHASIHSQAQSRPDRFQLAELFMLLRNSICHFKASS